tara:strand:- start:71 stop:415 length:345 start_codon:yes stop_codon:yes gene_type:complete
VKNKEWNVALLNKKTPICVHNLDVESIDGLEVVYNGDEHEVKSIMNWVSTPILRHLETVRVHELRQGRITSEVLQIPQEITDEVHHRLTQIVHFYSELDQLKERARLEAEESKS